ncbi:MAG: PDZ domain-containing protein [Alphaproteobacteria bacterium]|nr:PDZ domain-containing protein [Alphaproteobacteria bacterium]
MLTWLKRPFAGVLVLVVGMTPVVPRAVHAENQMGYQLLSTEDARALTRNGGSLGMDIEAGQRITSDGMQFELIRVKQVRRGSAGAQAGFHADDQIIAVDSRVFPDLAAFASYIRSVRPGDRITVDYLPAGGGPQSAERAVVTLNGAGAMAGNRPEQAGPEGGMSTRTKIGIAAVALFGCYELGCFKRHPPVQAQPNGVR